MSRSKKKTKIRGITTAVSEKQDKRDANRKLRRVVKQKVKKGNENLPELKDISNVWLFDKDGKTYDKKMNDRDLRK